MTYPFSLRKVSHLIEWIPGRQNFVVNLVGVCSRSSNPKVNVNSLVKVGLQSVLLIIIVEGMLRNLIELTSIVILSIHKSDILRDG